MKKIVWLALVVTLTFGVPAFKGELVFENSDGSTFKGHLKGDEHLNWVEDKQENIIKYNSKTKDYEFARVVEKSGVVKLVPSHIKADGIMKSPFKIDNSTLKKLWKNNKNKFLKKYNPA